jgi:hypothetical protein
MNVVLTIAGIHNVENNKTISLFLGNIPQSDKRLPSTQLVHILLKKNYVCLHIYITGVCT